eukprot:g1993.t1
MIARMIFSTVTLILSAAAATVPISNTAIAGGYGYGSQTGWSGYQAHAPKRNTVRKQVYAGSNRHLAWCYNRYRSYRLMDNSFQPYHGPRQECLSPYEQERRTLFVGYPDQAPEILFRDQAADGSELTVGDPVGNLPEDALAGVVSSGAKATQMDQFGNLPEQVSAEAAANAEPAASVGSDPVSLPQFVVKPNEEGEASIANSPDLQTDPIEEPSVDAQSDATSAQPVLPVTDTSAGSVAEQSAVRATGQDEQNVSVN